MSFFSNKTIKDKYKEFVQGTAKAKTAIKKFYYQDPPNYSREHYERLEKILYSANNQTKSDPKKPKSKDKLKISQPPTLEKNQKEQIIQNLEQRGAQEVENSIKKEDLSLSRSNNEGHSIQISKENIATISNRIDQNVEPKRNEETAMDSLSSPLEIKQETRPDEFSFTIERTDEAKNVHTVSEPVTTNLRARETKNLSTEPRQLSTALRTRHNLQESLTVEDRKPKKNERPAANNPIIENKREMVVQLKNKDLYEKDYGSNISSPEKEIQSEREELDADFVRLLEERNKLEEELFELEKLNSISRINNILKERNLQPKDEEVVRTYVENMSRSDRIKFDRIVELFLRKIEKKPFEEPSDEAESPEEYVMDEDFLSFDEFLIHTFQTPRRSTQKSIKQLKKEQPWRESEPKIDVTPRVSMRKQSSSTREIIDRLAREVGGFSQSPMR